MDATILFYDKNAVDYVKKTFDVDMKDLYIKFEHYIKKQSKIMDLGCGSARDTLYFLNQGYTVISIDPSIEMCKLANKNYGITVLNMKAEEMNYESEFDGIWACASLLHIKSKRIRSVLGKIEKALKTEGVLYASFKYGDNDEMEDDGRYIAYYNEDSIFKMFEGINNLEIREIWISCDYEQRNNWLNIIAVKQL